MHAWELKVPPLALMVLCAWLMVGVFVLWPQAVLWAWPWCWGVLPIVAGAGVALAGVLAFRRAATTVNPVTPQAASCVVTTGIYRVTRNPMYLGFALALLGWGLWLGHAVALVVPLAFVLYVNRFQIQPEERQLALKFGAPYIQYLQQVRRWL